jgi:hypothetical protein
MSADQRVLKVLPRLRGAGGGGGRGGGDASDASDASVMSQHGGGCSDGEDGSGARSSTSGAAEEGDAGVCSAEEDRTNTTGKGHHAAPDREALAEHEEAKALGQVKLAAARRKAAAVKYAAGDGASGDDHEARAVHHDVMAVHHRRLAQLLREGSATQGEDALAEVLQAEGTGAARGGRIRRVMEDSTAAAAEADPHNKFKGKFVTDKSGCIVRAEEPAGCGGQRGVAVDDAIGAAAMAVAGVGLASNGMSDDAPGDVAGNEKDVDGASWWCRVCL